MTTDISTNTTPTRGLALAERNNDAADFGNLVSMGDQLRRTGFLPSHIKDGVSFAAIVLMGREMGMGTMAACRKLQVIKGTVTERADSQLARFKSVGGRSQFKELSEAKAVLWLRHPNGDEHTETFTLEDAKRAGLASNDNYSKHPKAMLRSRAITAGLKSIGWEGAVGIYDPDEIVDATPAREPVMVRPQGQPARLVKSVTEVAPGMVVAHVKQFERPADERADPFEVAQAAIEAEADIGKLDAMRGRIDKRLQDGTFTAFQADALLDQIHARVEFLEAEQEVAK